RRPRGRGSLPGRVRRAGRARRLPRRPGRGAAPQPGARRRERGAVTEAAAYGPAELMAVAIARLLRDGEVVFQGVNSTLPMVSIALARRLHAPHLTYVNIA